MTLEVFFWISILGCTYSYFIYPIILVAVKKSGKKNLFQKTHPVDLEDIESLPAITFIITAFNEESLIKDKLDNTLEVAYPRQKLEILVASDGSTDGTNAIVERYREQGVELVDVTERLGKENAQLAAIRQAKGEILVFSDVSTRIETRSLSQIAERFQDPQIGAISSEDRFITSDGKVAGEGAYVKYEMWLRNQESSVHSLVGLSGSFFAARSEICEQWDISVPSDFNTALNTVRAGKVAVSAPELLGYYPNLKDETREYQRKVRTVIRGMAALWRKAEVLNPVKFGFFSFEVFSHKLMRWLVPVFLILALITNSLILQSGNIYWLTMLAQIAFYLCALLGWQSKKARENPAIKIAYFFVQVNLAILHSGIMFAGGKRVTVWTPSKR